MNRVARSKAGLRLGWDLTMVAFVGVISIVCAFSEKNLGSDLDPEQADKLVIKWRYLAQRAHV